MTQHCGRSSQSADTPEHLPAQNHAAAGALDTLGRERVFVDIEPVLGRMLVRGIGRAAAEVEGACPFLPVALHRFPEVERGSLTPQPLLAVARKRVVNKPAEAGEQRRTHGHALEASSEDASNPSAQKHPHWIRPAIAREHKLGTTARGDPPGGGSLQAAEFPRSFLSRQLMDGDTKAAGLPDGVASLGPERSPQVLFRDIQGTLELQTAHAVEP